MSTVKLQNIVHTGGTTAITIDSSGRVKMPNQPAFLAGCTTGTHTQTGGTVLDLNNDSSNVGFDIGNNWDTTNYRFTAPVAGTYAFHFNIYQQNSATQSSFCWRKNGVQLLSPGGDNLITYKSTINTGDFTMISNILLQLAANDYIDIAIRSGSSSVQWYGQHTWMAGHLIG